MAASGTGQMRERGDLALIMTQENDYNTHIPSSPPAPVAMPMLKCKKAMDHMRPIMKAKASAAAMVMVSLLEEDTNSADEVHGHQYSPSSQAK